MWQKKHFGSEEEEKVLCEKLIIIYKNDKKIKTFNKLVYRGFEHYVGVSFAIEADDEMVFTSIYH